MTLDPSDLDIVYTEMLESLYWTFEEFDAENEMIIILQHEGKTIYEALSILKMAKKMNGL